MSKPVEKSFEQRSAEALESIRSLALITMVIVSFVGFSVVTKIWMG